MPPWFCCVTNLLSSEILHVESVSPGQDIDCVSYAPRAVSHSQLTPVAGWHVGRAWTVPRVADTQTTSSPAFPALKVFCDVFLLFVSVLTTTGLCPSTGTGSRAWAHPREQEERICPHFPKAGAEERAAALRWGRNMGPGFSIGRGAVTPPVWSRVRQWRY